MANINDLPSEILDIILNLVLKDEHYEAAHVCKLWFSIFSRIAKLQVKDVPKEIIQDLIAVTPTDEEDQVWINLYQLLQVQQKIFRSLPELSRSTYKKRKFLSLDTEGVSMILALPPNKLVAINVSTDAETECIVGAGCPMEVLVAPKQSAVLVKTTDTITFFTLPLPHDFSFRELKLVPSEITWESRIFDMHRICVSCNYLANQISNRDVAIYNFVRLDKYTLAVEHRIDISTNSAILFMSIWDNELTCTLSGGDFVTFNILDGGSKRVVSRHHEIEYDNPTWCLRGTIFCSTANMKDLMGYWRFHEGFPTCLVGRATSPLAKCFGFGDCSSNLAALAINGRILACATTKNAVYLYYLSDAYFGGENLEVAKEFNRNADYVITASIQIYDLRLCSVNNSLLLILWSIKNDIEVIKISTTTS